MKVWAGQALHVAADVSPVSVLYLPCGHREQGADPLTSLYVPLPQATHSWPSGPVYPRLQLQLVKASLHSAEYECIGHALHVVSDTCPTPEE